MSSLDRLNALYRQQSKHSQYQVLPPKLRQLLATEGLETHSRHEDERFLFINSVLDFAGRTVVDIGANTGYFTFRAIEAGARQVLSYEGNPAHADFIRLSAEVLKIGDHLQIRGSYLNLPTETLGESCDIVLALNVLHHIGDDFGDTSLDATSARALVSEGIRQLLRRCGYLVLQLGYSWKGDRRLPLFERGFKQEQIDFVSASIGSDAEIVAVGMALREGESVVYSSPNNENLRRRDDWGEFLNRPLFILRSRLGATASVDDGSPNGAGQLPNV
jgi:SAM-dependent methyltransferase